MNAATTGLNIYSNKLAINTSEGAGAEAPDRTRTSDGQTGLWSEPHVAVTSIVAVVDANDCRHVGLRLVHGRRGWGWRRVVRSWGRSVGDGTVVAIGDERSRANEGSYGAGTGNSDWGDGFGSQERGWIIEGRVEEPRREGEGGRAGQACVVDQGSGGDWASSDPESSRAGGTYRAESFSIESTERSDAGRACHRARAKTEGSRAHRSGMTHRPNWADWTHRADWPNRSHRSYRANSVRPGSECPESSKWSSPECESINWSYRAHRSHRCGSDGFDGEGCSWAVNFAEESEFWLS